MIEENKEEEKVVEKEEEILENFEVEFTTNSEYIASAYYSLSAVQDIDTAIMNKEDEKRVKRIRRKSLKIIDACINDLYDELFEEDDED